jgi:CheY-like chemotaxis protein
MRQPFTILIADRNRHVREFLRRELEAEGYRVRVAKDGQKLLMMINLDDPPDLVVLDPEIPYMGELAVLDRIKEKIPPLPLVLHTFLLEYKSHPSIEERGAFVEKRGNIDHLKKTVLELLQALYPDRWVYGEDKGSERAGIDAAEDSTGES